MEIIDTYSDIILLFQNMHTGFEIEQWKKYINQISDGLAEKITDDVQNYDFNNDILPVLHFAMREGDKLEIAHQSFLKVVAGLNERIQTLTGTELQVTLIFYLGLCNGAGWATTWQGKRAVLLGIEKIVELGWHDHDTMTALIYHELGHVWHDTIGLLHQTVHTPQERGSLQLYQEGIAMYFEQLMIGDFSCYHQNKNDRFDWCMKNKEKLNREYLRRLRENESTQDFFGDWNDYQGHSDVGYFIGCEFIKWLAEKMPLDTLANLRIGTVYHAFSEYVTNTNYTGGTIQ